MTKAFNQKILVTTIIGLFVFSSCAQEKKPSVLKAVRIDLHWEFYFDRAAIDSSDRAAYIIYDKDYWILMNPYRVYNDKGEGKSPKISYDYFICKRGSPLGLKYDSLTSKVGRSYPVDSLIQSHLTTPSTVYSISDAKNQEAQSIRDEKSNLVIERIVNSKNPNLPGNDFAQDSSYFYYSKKAIQLPFFNKSEIFNDLYLYKCKVVFNEKTLVRNSRVYKFKKRKWLFEISETAVPDEEKVAALLERFRKSNSNL